MLVLSLASLRLTESGWKNRVAARATGSDPVMTGAPPPAPFEQRTIKHLLESRAHAAPASVLLRVESERFTSSGLNEIVNRAAHGLIGHGVAAGSTVCLLSNTTPEMIVTWLALAKIGAVCVPINVASRAPQISYITTNSRATSFIAGSECLPQLDPIEHGLERVERVVVLGSDHVDRDARLVQRRPASTFEALIDGSRTTDPDVAIDPTAAASIICHRRYHRSSQGRPLLAQPLLLVGTPHGARARRWRRRRLVDVPALLPRNAQAPCWPRC